MYDALGVVELSMERPKFRRRRRYTVNLGRVGGKDEPEGCSRGTHKAGQSAEFPQKSWCVPNTMEMSAGIVSAPGGSTRGKGARQKQRGRDREPCTVSLVTTSPRLSFRAVLPWRVINHSPTPMTRKTCVQPISALRQKHNESADATEISSGL